MPEHSVVLSSWLKQQGFTDQLIKRYHSSQWLEPLGRGAYQRSGSRATWLGAIHALQTQSSLDLHVGGPTSFAMLGMAQYVAPEIQHAWVFSAKLPRLPKWMRERDLGAKMTLVRSTLLPAQVGMQAFPVGSFAVTISSPARAMMECLQLAPRRYSLMECYELMENLPTLRVSVAQELLEQCQSVKVARLFLFLAERAGHPWASRIDTGKINLGRGKRELAKDGVYNAKYQLVVPPELA